CFFALFLMVCYFTLRLIEMAFVIRKKRPLYRHIIPFRKLTENQQRILESDFEFYKKLEDREKRYFEHRVASLIKDKFFIGREGLVVTDEMKVLISATAAMLTFGFRDFYIGLISKIFIYPDEFYSNINEEFHKGEFNPKLKALVISWKHFKEGFEIANDNVNLGIHEFTHAIHLNSIKERDVSSTIFEDSFKELIELIAAEDDLRNRLVQAEYFRDYAFTNQFEFLAVIVESFIENPGELKNQFPKVYYKVQQMLNFNFAGY
ncbi:MAG: zinc-dependent peptidase, partial [Bacteroidia bacterium]|nr:zinc-dependent peptidase [Bacteroidia bacterium]